MSNSIRGSIAALALAVLTACGGGGGGGSTPSNQAPRALALASGDVQTEAGILKVTAGALVRLDASGSTDADGDTLSYQWSLVSKPEGSSATLPATTGRVLEWQPEVRGKYTVRLQVTDSQGASSQQQIEFQVENRAPVSNVTVTAQFSAIPTTHPTQPMSVGGSAVVDATASTDPDGDPVTVAVDWLQRPTGSTALLTKEGKITRFTADLAGFYELRVRGTDPDGAGFESVYSFDAQNRAPNPVLIASMTPVTADGGSSSVEASVGYDVMLDGTSSSDPDGDTVSRTWSLSSAPTGSAAALSSTDAARTSFSPDVLGDYVVTLTVTDSRGAKSLHKTTVRVNNRRPVAQISTNATPQALPSLPRVLVPLGTEVTLRGSTSTDADGDALTYAWQIDARPAGSTAALSSDSAADPRFTADKEGSYVFRLRVSDAAGAFSERLITLDVGTHAPVAVVDKGNVTLLAGTALRASAALSFDEDGDALSYRWTLDARPAGSAAAIATPGNAELVFTPDVPGLYVAAVTVSDGHTSSVAYLTIRALSQIAQSVTLSFAPSEVHYSTGLDRLVAVSTNPNTVRIVDPFGGSIRAVPLPLGVRSLKLSPDGTLAVALHDGMFSLVDLRTATLVRTTASQGDQTDAFVTDAGTVFLIGQSGGQWVDEAVASFNGRTGEKIPQSVPWGSGTFYGTQYGVMAGRINKVFLMSQGLSPADISYFKYDPDTHKVLETGESPYHGDYAMSVPLYLSGGTQDLLFTVYGTYFSTDTLSYAGRLSGITHMLGFSHSAAQQEALALQSGPSDSYYDYKPTYPASYARFTGALLVPDGSLALPQINGAQSYGMKVFHSASGSHVLLVQTGSNKPLGDGAAYHVIVR